MKSNRIPSLAATSLAFMLNSKSYTNFMFGHSCL